MEKGVTRLVFKVNKYVIKIPNFTYSHLHFLDGCYNNWSERNFCKQFKLMPDYYDKVAPSLFCSWFGLIQIQYYCKPLKSKNEISFKRFEELTKLNSDNKLSNFGFYKNNVVLVDYP